ncbi:MAG: hypothetical protein KBE91_02595 [Bacteroidia bacterium]|nr:hypothetical protein [Bacteroidia bacterium]
MNEKELQTLANATVSFIAIAQAISNQSIHFTGLFKHEKKKRFNTLLKTIDEFLKTKDNNVTENDSIASDEMEDYIHDMLTDMQKEYSVEVLFNELCHLLQFIYKKYIYSNYRHKEKQAFIDAYTVAYNYPLTSTFTLSKDLEHFISTLIEGGEYTKTLISNPTNNNT